MKHILPFILSLLLVLLCIPSCKGGDDKPTRTPVRATDVWNMTQIKPQYPASAIEGYYLRPSGEIVTNGKQAYIGYMDGYPGSDQNNEFFYPYKGDDTSPERMSVPGLDALPASDARYTYTQLRGAAYTDAGTCGAAFNCSGGDQFVITDKNGTTVASVSLDDCNTRGENLHEVYWSSADGGFYIRAESGVFFVSADGSVVESVKLSAALLGIGSTRDGRCYTVAYPTGGGDDFGAPQITCINGDTRAPESPLLLPETMNLYNVSLCPHPSYDLCYNAGDVIYGYNFPGTKDETAEPVPVLNYLNSDLDSSEVRDVVFLDDDTAFTMRSAFGSTEQVCVTLSRVSEDELPAKYELHVAVCGVSAALHAAAKAFNASSETCRIVFDNYDRYASDAYDTAGNTNNAYAALERDILAGYRPDIIIGNGYFDLDNLAGQGLFCDIYSFLDNAPDFGRDALLGCVMTPFEDENGKLPYLVTSFSVRSLLAEKETAATLAEGGFTAANAQAAEQALPDGTTLAYYNDYKGEGALSVLDALLPHYLDYADDPAVMTELLSYCQSAVLPDMKSEERRDAIQNGSLSATEMRYFIPQQFMQTKYETFGGTDFAFLGFPMPTTAEAVGTGSDITAGELLAITTDALDIPEIADGAWEFCKLRATYLDEEYLASNLSAARSTLEGIFALIEGYHFVIGDDGQFGFGATISGGNGRTEVFLTEDDKILLRALYDGITTRRDKDESLAAIITEDASAYFAGAKTLEETVHLITSRAKTYIAERE